MPGHCLGVTRLWGILYPEFMNPHVSDQVGLETESKKTIPMFFYSQEILKSAE